MIGAIARSSSQKIRNHRSFVLRSFQSQRISTLTAAQQSSSVAPSLVVRSFHKSTAIYKDQDKNEPTTNASITDQHESPDDYSSSDDNVPLFQTIHSTFTDEEIAKIIEGEEAKLIAEEQSKFVPNWKPGMRKRPLVSSIRLEDFERELLEDKQAKWTLRDKRCGALAIKVGMVPVFDPTWGQRYPCTILWMDSNVVVGHKTFEKHGYAAIQVAAGQRKRKNVGISVLGQYKHIINHENDPNPPYLMREFRISEEAHLLPIGDSIFARHFCPGQNIDVSAITKGKGFQGGMKRHGFGGMPASHGVTKSHRALGSTGQCQDPGKVWKGKKMAGRMGGTRVTIQNLRVVKVDRGRNLLYVLGAVPGNNGAFVEVRDAVKKPLWNSDKIADALNRPPLPTFAYDKTIDGSGQAYEEFMPLPQSDPLDPDVGEEAA